MKLVGAIKTYLSETYCKLRISENLSAEFNIWNCLKHCSSTLL